MENLSEKEISILEDLQRGAQDGISPTQIKEDIMDSPEDYNYSEDDLEIFLGAHPNWSQYPTLT
jgi:hypothetical protein